MKLTMGKKPKPSALQSPDVVVERSKSQVLAQKVRKEHRANYRDWVALYLIICSLLLQIYQIFFKN